MTDNEIFLSWSFSGSANEHWTGLKEGTEREVKEIDNS